MCIRDSGINAEVHGSCLDNRYVVPYNAYLLAKFNCHINVEAVSYTHLDVYKRQAPGSSSSSGSRSRRHAQPHNRCSSVTRRYAGET